MPKNNMSDWLRRAAMQFRGLRASISELGLLAVRTTFDQAVAAASIFSFCVLLLGMGPTLQQYVFATLNSNATSLYESVYENCVAQFPDLGGWLVAGFYLWWWIPSLLVTAAVMSSASIRSILIRSGAACFVGIMAYDILYVIFGDGIGTAQQIFENFVANLLGSILLGSLIVTALAVAQKVSDITVGSPRVKCLSASASVVLFGLLISVVIFYAAKMIYQPVPSRLDLTLSNPASGHFSVAPNEGLTSKETKRPDSRAVRGGDDASKSFLPNVTTKAYARWMLPDGRGDLRWESRSSEQSYDAQVYLVEDCDSVEKLEDIEWSLKGNGTTFTAIRSLSLSAGRGISTMHLNWAGTAQGLYKASIQKPSMYWLDRDGQDNSTSLTQFIGDESSASIVFGDVRGDIDFAFEVTLAEERDGGMAPSDRELRLHVDGKAYEMNLDAPKLWDPNRRLKCRASGSPFGQPVQRKTVNALIATLVVRISAKNGPVPFLRRDQSQLLATGGSGWLAVSNLAQEDLSSKAIGPLSMLNVSGSVKHAVANGVEFELRPSDSLTAMGELTGRFEESGDLRVTGMADELWNGTTRLNTTRWESMKTEFQLLLLALFGSFVLFIWRLASPVISSEEQLTWLIPRSSRLGAERSDG